MVSFYVGLHQPPLFVLGIDFQMQEKYMSARKELGKNVAEVGNMENTSGATMV